MTAPRDLDPVLARCRASWPAVRLEPEVFRAWLCERVPATTPLDDVPVTDLYLACACAASDAGALAAFEAHYLTEVAVAAAKVRAAPGILDEARQVVRVMLFVPRPNAGPAITTYTGRGDLRGWVRVIAMREVLRIAERDSREVTTDDDTLLEALSPANDPGLELFKDRYREELATAFRAALDGLTPRERTLLRYQLVDGLGIEAIGSLYKVHRATAARWLIHARETLLEATRSRLLERLDLTPQEADSMIRLVHSRIDVSIERHLAK